MTCSTAFAYLADATGASVDELKLISSFLFSYPLAALLKRIPDSKPYQKNIFICTVSLFYIVGLFDLWSGLRTIFISSAGAYAIAHYIDGSLMPWIAFVFLMGHMSVSHIYRQFAADPSAVDITGAQMVLVMKLTAFCWNVHDGRLKPDLLTDTQKEKAIYDMPDFLDYAGYVLFFPSLFAGPAFDYNDYRAWIETTMFEVPGDVKAPPTKKKRKIPRSGIPATWKAVGGLAWIFLFLQLGGMYNNETILDDQYMQYSFPRRIWLLYALGFTSRLKYYGVWSLTEGACILSGMGFNGVDTQTGKLNWDRLNNVNPWGIETAQNSRGYLENWNKNTNNWLRNYVYLRVTPKGKKPGFRASLATFATSAFWHGFYPGYYLTFILGAFIQTVAKNIRRYVRPFVMTPDGKKGTSNKMYYDAVCWVVTQFTFCFVTAPFVILGFSDSIKAWARVYFYAIIGVGGSMAFFSSPAKVYLIKQLKKREPEDNLKRTYSHDQIKMPVLGMSDDPSRDIDEVVAEIKQEVDTRRRRGSKIEMPSGESLRRAVEQKLKEKIDSGELRFRNTKVDKSVIDSKLG